MKDYQRVELLKKLSLNSSDLEDKFWLKFKKEYSEKKGYVFQFQKVAITFVIALFIVTPLYINFKVNNLGQNFEEYLMIGDEINEAVYYDMEVLEDAMI